MLVDALQQQWRFGSVSYTEVLIDTTIGSVTKTVTHTPIQRRRLQSLLTIVLADRITMARWLLIACLLALCVLAVRSDPLRETDSDSSTVNLARRRSEPLSREPLEQPIRGEANGLTIENRITMRDMREKLERGTRREEQESQHAHFHCRYRYSQRSSLTARCRCCCQ